MNSVYSIIKLSCSCRSCYCKTCPITFLGCSICVHLKIVSFDCNYAVLFVYVVVLVNVSVHEIVANVCFNYIALKLIAFNCRNINPCTFIIRNRISFSIKPLKLYISNRTFCVCIKVECNALCALIINSLNWHIIATGESIITIVEKAILKCNCALRSLYCKTCPECNCSGLILVRLKVLHLDVNYVFFLVVSYIIIVIHLVSLSIVRIVTYICLYYICCDFIAIEFHLNLAEIYGNVITFGNSVKSNCFACGVKRLDCDRGLCRCFRCAYDACKAGDYKADSRQKTHKFFCVHFFRSFHFKFFDLKNSRCFALRQDFHQLSSLYRYIFRYEIIHIKNIIFLYFMNVKNFLCYN